MTAALGPQQPDEVRTTLYGCWHPAGCQSPGDGCHGPCPVTPKESRRLEAEMYGPATLSAQPDEVRLGSLRAQQQLDDLRAENERPFRLGCSLVAHRDLGFCSGCTGVDVAEELYGWRLLAIAERGIPARPAGPTPAQPVRNTKEGRQ